MKKLSDSQFKKYCALVYREAGINLTGEKRELLNARLAKRLRKLEIDAKEYYERINHDPDELRIFLDAISTNHTFFFRESRSFAYLDSGPSEIWCAASSSGEEPYSLATYCLDKGFRPNILATDISVTCLEKGRKGVYPAQVLSNIPKHMLKAHFQKGQGKWEGYIRVKPEVQRMVNFERFNLLKDATPQKAFDMVFCRNVMIYFDSSTKEFVVEKLVRTLKPGGYFIIGGAESLSGLKHSLKYVEPSVYRK